MTRIILVLVVLISSQLTFANENSKMTPETLFESIQNYTKSAKIENDVISFKYNQVNLYCVWDSTADRMRIITPIANTSDLSVELLELALRANYHTVLDARYAIGDDILYAAFIHPLSSITKKELESAIRQVTTSALTFGTSFSSGELVFPGESEETKNDAESSDI
ncbi:MAG: hypothetical protein ACPGJI_06085 [Kangiellaceae bacterium]